MRDKGRERRERGVRRVWEGKKLREVVYRSGREKRMEKKREMFAGENGLQGDPRLKGISEAIRVVPHFPKPGPFFVFFRSFILCFFVGCCSFE